MAAREMDVGKIIPLVSGEVVATNVSADEYLEKYAADYCEWVGGVVIRMSPVGLKHNDLTDYLRDLARAYFSSRPLGKILSQPFVMRLDATGSAREPDLQIILHSNAGKLTETAMVGPADICIEVVSPESVERDYGTKLEEYEKGGVGEYWLFDSQRKIALFYRLDEAGLYHLISLDETGIYQTPKLPDFRLHVPTLWEDTLPDIVAIVEAVKKMLADA